MEDTLSKFQQFKQVMAHFWVWKQ